MIERFQNRPVQNGSMDATDDEKVAGIIAQVRADVDAGDDDDPEGMLRERLHDAGIEVEPERFRALLNEVGS